MALKVTSSAMPGPPRLWLYRRISGVTLLSRRSLRNLGGGTGGDPARSDGEARLIAGFDPIDGILRIGRLLNRGSPAEHPKRVRIISACHGPGGRAR